jgi:hypothetical protein
MITRLHSKYPDLAQQILAAPRDNLRLVAATAARFAIRTVSLEGSLLEAALAAIDRREQPRSGLQAQLEELQRRWDDQYLDVQDSLGPHQELPAEALEAFHRARALAAVLGAFKDTDGPATTDVVYETITSSSNKAEIVSAISKLVEH